MKVRKKDQIALPPEDILYEPKEAFHFKKLGFEMHWVKCCVCDKTGLRFRHHAFCSANCISLARKSLDPHLRNLHDLWYYEEINNPSSLIPVWINPEEEKKLDEIVPNRYSKNNKSNHVETVDFSNFIESNFHCPFNMEIWDFVKDDTRIMHYIDSIFLWFENLGYDWTSSLETYQYEIIDILNDSYRKSIHRMDSKKSVNNELYKFLKTIPDERKIIDVLLESLDDYLSKIKFRKVSGRTYNLLFERYPHDQIHLTSKWINEQGIKKTIGTFEDLDVDDFVWRETPVVKLR